MHSDQDWENALSEALKDWSCVSAADVLNNLSTIYQAFEFQGFDAEIVRQTLVIRHKSFALGTKLKFDGGIEVQLEGPKTNINLITLLAAVFLSRGNNTISIQRFLRGDVRTTFAPT